jgi:hypothetical protein
MCPTLDGCYLLEQFLQESASVKVSLFTPN